MRYKSDVQPELSGQIGACILGRLFQRCGSDLPEDSNYGNTLIKGGMIMCRIGEIETEADQCIRERFLRPIIKSLEEDLRHFDVRAAHYTTYPRCSLTRFIVVIFFFFCLV